MAAHIDPDHVLRDWSARGYAGGTWVDPPGQAWEDFVHATDELVMLLEGEIEMEFGGRRFCPAVGEEILIPAGTSHSVWNVGRVTSRWLYAYRS